MVWEKKCYRKILHFVEDTWGWPPQMHLDRKSEQANRMLPADADCNQSDPGNSSLLDKIEHVRISVGKFSKDLGKWVQQKTYCAL